MKHVDVIYVPDEIHPKDMKQPRIFLAGPTPRDRNVPSWRPEFIKLLENKCFNCTVFVPETADGWWADDYDVQCEWEHHHLHTADYIAFWIPRDLEKMPAFTTNVEFGYWISQSTDFKVFYGRPDGAPKTKYLDWLYLKEIKEKPATSMEQLIDNIIDNES